MMTIKASYSEHIIQIDFGDSTAHHIKHIAPDLQQQKVCDL